MKRHSEFAKRCAACCKADKKCMHPPATAVEKLRSLLLLSTIKPFTIIFIICNLGQLSGTYALRPFWHLIFRAYGTPISPSNATVVLGLAGILGTMTCICIVKFVGKRKLLLISLVLVCIPKIAVGKFSENVKWLVNDQMHSDFNCSTSQIYRNIFKAFMVSYIYRPELRRFIPTNNRQEATIYHWLHL